MPLGKVVGLGPGHIVLDGDPVGTQPPQQPLPTLPRSAHAYCDQTVAHLSNYRALVQNGGGRHLGFFKFRNVKGRNGQEGQCASPRQIP